MIENEEEQVAQPAEEAHAPVGNATDGDAPDDETPGDETPDGDAPQGALDLSRAKLSGAPPVPEGENGAEAAAEAKAEAVEEPEPAEPLDFEKLGRTIEALLFAAESPLTAREMARAAGVRGNDLRKALTQVQERYEQENRPWEITEVANGFRMVTRPEFFPAIQKLRAQRTQRKLTPAALETLAFIAYSKDPVTRAEVEKVRGVDSGPVLRQLLDRKLIRIAGRSPGLGQALLYAVSNEFLEHFGLKSVQDLPRPGEFRSA